MTDPIPSRDDIRQQAERVRESLRSARDLAASARCGPISPVSCPRAGCSWRVHGIPDKYTSARAWEVEQHINDQHGTPTEGTEGATGGPERPGVDTEPPGVLAGHQAGTESFDDLSVRWDRRAEHGVLLSHTQPDVLLDAVRPLLRAAVERELTDTKQAWTESDRLRVERDRALRLAVELEQQLAAVTDLHYPVSAVDHGSACDVCDVPWPCPTIRATDPLEDQ